MHISLNFNFQITIIHFGYRHLKHWDTVSLRPHWRLYFNPTNGASVTFKHKVCQLNKDTILLLPPNTPFTHELQLPCHTFYLHFSLHHPYPRAQDNFFPIHPQQEHLDTLQNILDIISTPIQSNQTSPRLKIQLVSLASQCLTKIPENLLLTPQHPKKVEKLLNCLHMSPLAEHQNDILASQVHLTVSAMIRLFRKSIGLPPQAYLQNLRLKHAAKLLTDSDASIEEIAEKCLFCDRHYFSKRFKAIYQISPGQYRKSSRFT